MAVHSSPYAGTWYPRAASELGALLDRRFDRSLARTGPYLFPDGLAYVTPHAGPAYSGTVAAAVYRSLRQQAPERVILLAFPHRALLNGVARPEVNAIATPLGTVELDQSFGADFPAVDEGRVCDHSFEIQLPFLQKAIPQSRITALYVGEMDAGQRAEAAARLAGKWRPGTVFVASSDFNHYGPDFSFVPFRADGAVASRLRALDGECIDAAGSLDSALFLETIRQHRATVCGTGPISLLLETLARLGGAEIYQSMLDYETSGELLGDYRNSVSYAALGYYRQPAFDLGAEDQKVLADSAAATLHRLRETGAREPIEPEGGSPALEAHRGVFVSLHHEGELLGCLGSPFSEAPLRTEVPRLALAAALDDPRFRHDRPLPANVQIEISVLTPMRRIRNSAQVSVGRHGVLLKRGLHTGLLLPQVAAERDWTAEQFLKAVCRKALTGPEDWRHRDARLFVFGAQLVG